jgi:transcriptional regulator with XRE-family HTH domain
MQRRGRPSTATPTNPFAEALARVLEERTQTEVANLLGISQPLVSAWLSGDKLPGSHLLPQLAEIGIPEGLYYDALRARNLSTTGYKKSPKSLT